MISFNSPNPPPHPFLDLLMLNMIEEVTLPVTRWWNIAVLCRLFVNIMERQWFYSVPFSCCHWPTCFLHYAFTTDHPNVWIQASRRPWKWIENVCISITRKQTSEEAQTRASWCLSSGYKTKRGNIENYPGSWYLITIIIVVFFKRTSNNSRHWPILVGDGDALCFLITLMINECIINVVSWSTYRGPWKCYALFLVLIENVCMWWNTLGHFSQLPYRD